MADQPTAHPKAFFPESVYKQAPAILDQINIILATLADKPTFFLSKAWTLELYASNYDNVSRPRSQTAAGL